MMTYRSNPFDKQDYSKFAFKKSELLEILRAIDSSFSFDSPTCNNQKSEQLSSYSNSQYDYKFYLFKKPLLTFHEAACIMTGYDPQYVDQCQNDTNFRQNFSDYLGAYDYINACIDAQMLSYDNDSNRLYSNEFQQFLANQNIEIKGFNEKEYIDYLAQKSLKEQKEFNSQIPSAQTIEAEIFSTDNRVLELEKSINKLKVELQEKDDEIEQLKNDIQKKNRSVFEISPEQIYTTPALEAVKAVVNHWWKDFDPDSNQPQSIPQQKHIKTWIAENHPEMDSDYIQTAIDKICRHPTAKNGGNRKFNF
ncbi:coiled-coil domain-containing protein [Acinetobacter sp. WCHAc010052]|uniref:coiled-coil domain-containing protein n=1 Tax=Acinetobacter sp. WCHAc010052 TaxID=2004647 RepID=UPI00196B62DE|nr:hypothetical protein [Acinetobacter sp. WCHAc010052]